MHYLGIDVAKAKLDCALLDTTTDKRKTKSIPNNASGFALMADWLGKYGITLTDLHAVLEATGVYHEAVALWLADAGVTVSIANPAQVKDFARGLAVRTKTDGVDSVVLARYGALVKPQPWTPPPPEVRELKALLARLEALETDVRRELNRQEKATLSSVPALVQQSLDAHLAVLKHEIARLHTAIDDHIDRHPGLKADQAYLLSIPAVGEKTANRMVALLHSRTFKSAEQVAAFLGLVPVEHQSGSSVLKRPHLSKNGDAKTRAVLYMAAIVATRYNPDIKAMYERLCARGKPKMVALGAAMRKLVHQCFGVIKHQQPYRQNGAVSA
ncbi:MAG TPA: IS110 family transposase [bacterium]|nr:IS110 family transposase [bacterium]